EVNPEAKEYTWTNNVVETRIDYIWVSEDLSSGLMDAEIREVEIFTGSDHKAVTAKLLLNRLIGRKGLAKIKRNGSFRYKFLFDETQEEDWDVFREALWMSLKEKNKIRNFLNREMIGYKEDFLDEIWDTVEGCLLKAARIAIPRKKVWNNLSERKE
ncbi:24700_t:CDS:1, partial [Gigaspora rosea]